MPRVEEEKSHGPYGHADQEYIPGPTPYRGAGAGADFDDYDDDSGNNTGDDVFLDRGYHRDPEPATAGPYVPIDLHNDLVEATLRRSDIAWRNEVRAHIRRTRRAREKARKYKSRSTQAVFWLVSFVSIYLYLAFKKSPTTLGGSILYPRYIPPHDSWMLQTREDIFQIPSGYVEISDVERAYKEKIKPWEEGGWLCGSLIEEKRTNGEIRNNGTVSEHVCELARKTYNDIWETFLREQEEIYRRR